MSQNVQQRFADALERILEREPASVITVTQLAKESGLSRRSFYNNFIDIYDFLFSVHLLRTQDITDSFFISKDYLQSLLTILNRFKEHCSFYKILIKTQGPNSFINSLNLFLLNFSLKMLKEDPSPELKFCLEVYWAGTSYKFCEWIGHDMQTPPKELAQLFISAMPDIMKQHFFQK